MILLNDDKADCMMNDTLINDINEFYDSFSEFEIFSFDDERKYKKEFFDFTIVPWFVLDYYHKDFLKPLPIYSVEKSDFRMHGRQRNHFFDNAYGKYFVVYGKMHEKKYPIGRLIAYVDDLYYGCNNNRKLRIGWIGGFEAINNDIMFDLISKAINYLKSLNVDKILANARFNANGEIGLMLEAKVKPNFLEPYNPLYYNKFFQELEFEKETDWYAYAVDKETIYERLNSVHKVANFSRKKNPEIVLRHIGKKGTLQFKQDVKALLDLYNREWDDYVHPQFRKMTQNEVKKLVNDLKSIALEDLIIIAEHRNSVIGTIVNLPNIYESVERVDKEFKEMICGFIASGNLNYAYEYLSKDLTKFNLLMRDLKILNQVHKDVKQKNYSTYRTLIMGVKRDYRKRGIEALLIEKTMDAFIKNYIHNFEFLSGSQLAETNKDIVNLLSKIGRKTFTWRVYSKYI